MGHLRQSNRQRRGLAVNYAEDKWGEPNELLGSAQPTNNDILLTKVPSELTENQ
jgi:hypothetical protein